ncbi:uncharacterized protein PADG_04664 [Paracoccidioides brasiliensis Pb18]|uniref:Uncharacterized protein n=1 Tax=Paracoccidioides brasiliensis (strain Pb18) TaxID=502780 RepID=C1GCE2_PARBD|nr:uncharacterized protein PADG_04664 [Paracoccidioides brasiliensis Pb18]EEH48585.2 hypothetical protein PADG_04664 [Paracoccidioides brasiliensis Pb18]
MPRVLLHGLGWHGTQTASMLDQSTPGWLSSAGNLSSVSGATTIIGGAGMILGTLEDAMISAATYIRCNENTVRTFANNSNGVIPSEERRGRRFNVAKIASCIDQLQHTISTCKLRLGAGTAHIAFPC